MPRAGRKEQIIEAAQALFSAKGYHATTIRDIAEETGIRSGSLYAHIQTKEDLLYAIVARSAEQFMARLEPIAAAHGPAAERLRAALSAHVELVATSTEAATVFLHEWRALDPERWGAVQTMRSAYEALWDRIIADGVRSGEFRPVDRKFARLLALSAANWLYQWYAPDGPLSPPEIADRFADLILAALTPTH